MRIKRETKYWTNRIIRNWILKKNSHSIFFDYSSFLETRWAEIFMTRKMNIIKVSKLNKLFFNFPNVFFPNLKFCGHRPDNAFSRVNAYSSTQHFSYSILILQARRSFLSRVSFTALCYCPAAGEYYVPVEEFTSHQAHRLRVSPPYRARHRSPGLVRNPGIYSPWNHQLRAHRNSLRYVECWSYLLRFVSMPFT